MLNNHPSIDPLAFRQVLGRYPTGVCAICAVQPDGAPIGMVVGSFTSVSLSPPLVAFFPDKNSSSWAKLSNAPKFCVNILSAEQEQLCRKLSSSVPDKFADVPYRLSPLGSPILDGVVAWIDCETHSVVEAGDHFIVQGIVRQSEIANGGLPLLFFQGGYGRFTPSSIMSVNLNELLADQLRIIELARPEMESIAADLHGQCVAQTRLGDEIIVVASAGQPDDQTPPILMGQRAPFIAPSGTVFAAWLPEQQREQWITRQSDPARHAGCREAIAAVRQRGYSVGLEDEAALKMKSKLGGIAAAAVPARPAELAALISVQAFDPPRMTAEICASVGLILAPVFDASGGVAMCLVLRGFPQPSSEAQIARHTARLLQGTRVITDRVGGHEPAPA